MGFTATNLDEMAKGLACPEAPNEARDLRPIALRRARRLIHLLIQRGMEGLALYQPLPAAVPFHKCRKKWRVLDGSNQSGKTLAAAVEFARAVCGVDDKYPKSDGRGLVVGLDGDHLADPLWAKVARSGAFFIIRDKQTRLWRPVRANPDHPTEIDPYDEAYREKWREAPPLIPPRLIKEIAWEERKRGVPRILKMRNGWETLWRSSVGDAPQGRIIHLGWIDEQIENEEFYKEMFRGLMTGRGRGVWSATPQITNEQLQDLRERAEGGSLFDAAFQLLLDDNPFIPREEKQAFWNALSEEEREVRYYGHYAIMGRRIYSYEPMGQHGVEPYEVPLDHTRFVILDPGRQYCGTLFFSVDPDETHCTLYDGFVLKNADAGKWADMIAEREHGIRFEAGVCDYRAGRQKPMGASKTVARQYMEALNARGVQFRTPGPLEGFFPGSDDVEAREEALLNWLRPRCGGPSPGTPYFRTMRGRLPEFDKQIRRAHYDNKNPDKRKKLREDLLVCAEYGAAFDCHYRPPEKIAEPREDSFWKRWKKKQARRDRQSSSDGIILY